MQISGPADFANGAQTGNAAIGFDSKDLLFKCTEIQVNQLDHIFDSLGVNCIEFIKVNIEGHEERFLAGALNIIHRFRPTLYVEIN